MAVTPINDTVSYTDSAGKTQQAQGVVVLAGGGGSGGGGGLTNAELRATPVPVIARFTSGGNLSVNTNADGATFTAFPSQACTQVTVINDTAFSFEVRQGGAGVAVPVLAQSSFSFFGATNANQFSVRRKDLDVEVTTVYIRWES